MTLIRLMDYEKDCMISAFETHNAADLLMQYQFCKEHEISIDIPHDFDDENDKYKDKESGMIEEIHVCFGGKGGNLPCIDIWIGDIY